MRKGTKQIWSKKEQTDVFLSFSGTKRNELICSQKSRIEGRRTASMFIYRKKIRKKEGSSFFGSKAKSKGFDQKKTEDLTLLINIINDGKSSSLT